MAKRFRRKSCLDLDEELERSTNSDDNVDTNEEKAICSPDNIGLHVDLGANSEADDSTEDMYNMINSDSEDDTQIDEWITINNSTRNQMIEPFTTDKPTGVQLTDTQKPENELGYFQLYYTDELLDKLV